jgi:hypothetical protein
MDIRRSVEIQDDVIIKYYTLLLYTLSSNNTFRRLNLEFHWLGLFMSKTARVGQVILGDFGVTCWLNCEDEMGVDQRSIVSQTLRRVVLPVAEVATRLRVKTTITIHRGHQISVRHLPRNAERRYLN